MSKSGDDGTRLFGRSRTIQDVLLNVSRVRLDLSHAHLRDIIAIEALDRIMHTFRRNGIDVSGRDDDRAVCDWRAAGSGRALSA
ncbi:sulfate transporter [Burkholderia anthina]|nr:sulfate transporter [Burkholderia anthina]